MLARADRAVLVALALALVACASSPLAPVVTAQHLQRARAERPETSLAELDAGRTLYTRRCAGCHTLVDPRTITAGQWPAEVTEMRERAKLDDEQVETLVRYLVAVSSDTPTSG